MVLALAPGAGADEPVDYLKQIKPLLKERCFACHGALKQRGGLRLDTVAFMKEGGDSGPALDIKSPAKSLLVQRLQATDETRMPPKDEAEHFTPQQIALVRAWIAQGAPGPAQETAEEDPRKHWAFRAPVRPAMPKLKNPAWVRNPIDAFVGARHEALNITPVADAPKEILLRRVYLDLLGLPPTRAELLAFLQDPSDNAYEKVVDELLTRPQYGERWGRHWMDVWRYSDWYGRRSVNDVRNSAPQIWRWRDWIVNSLNRDKGYDRMVQEMLAADEIAPDDAESSVATGFLVRNWYSLNPHEWMRHNVEHTGKAFLGLTFNCAHCHDHKYDPISQEDYFRMRAFFEPLGVRQDRVPGEADPGPFEKYNFASSRKIVKLGRVSVYDELPKAPTHMYLGGDERQKAPGKPPIAPGLPAFFGKGALSIEPVSLPVSVVNPGLQEWFQAEERKQRRIEIESAQSALTRAKDAKNTVEIALAESRLEIAQMSLESFELRAKAERIKHGQESGEWKPQASAASRAERRHAAALAKERWLKAELSAAPTRIKAATAAPMDRDAALAALKKAEQAVLDAKKNYDAALKAVETASETYAPLSPEYPSTSTGRRKALAQWITSPTNPLTARVAVNHIWMRHFDRPFVESVFDFGRNGKKPTHPELLDWLAVEFMESGWSMKHLHRLIVTSHVYRLHSAGDNPADPDNRTLWRYPARRMEAEVVRDTLLYLGGELDLRLGGPPLENTEEAGSKRRSLYFSIYPEDGGHPKFLEIFDAPDACDCYRRQTSIIPQQALALANNTLSLNQSRLLARRLSLELRDSGDDEAYLTLAFEHILSRAPTEAERRLCRDFLAQQSKLFETTPQTPPATTGLIPPASVPGQRARESLVRVLFSHNDFVTVR
jgi:mono/diheme cytochrome c family protein